MPRFEFIIKNANTGKVDSSGIFEKSSVYAAEAEIAGKTQGHQTGVVKELGNCDTCVNEEKEPIPKLCVLCLELFHKSNSPYHPHYKGRNNKA